MARAGELRWAPRGEELIDQEAAFARVSAVGPPRSFQRARLREALRMLAETIGVDLVSRFSGEEMFQLFALGSEAIAAAADPGMEAILREQFQPCSLAMALG